MAVAAELGAMELSRMITASLESDYDMLRDRELEQGATEERLQSILRQRIEHYNAESSIRAHESRIEQVRTLKMTERVRSQICRDLDVMKGMAEKWKSTQSELGDLNDAVRRGDTMTVLNLLNILQPAIQRFSRSPKEDIGVRSVLRGAEEFLENDCAKLTKTLETALSAHKTDEKTVKDTLFLLDMCASSTKVSFPPTASQLMLQARQHLAAVRKRKIVGHIDTLRESINSGNAVAIGAALANVQKEGSLHDHQLAKQILAARRAQSSTLKLVYQELRDALRCTTPATIRVVAFKDGMPCEAPTGLVSEWSYDVNRDVYSFPCGPIGTTELRGLQQGTKISRCVERRVGESGCGAFNRVVRTSPLSRGSLRWSFEVVGPPITSLRIRAVCSAASGGEILWCLRGGRTGSGVAADDAPSELVERLGSSCFVNFDEIAAGKWNWFTLEVRITGSASHEEDAQVFRSCAGSIAGPQLQIQIGIPSQDLHMDQESSTSDLEISQIAVESALQSCQKHGVARLGPTARALISRGNRVLRSRGAKK